MPIIPTVDGGTLLNALRMGRQDREAFEDRSLQRMFTQQKMDDARKESERKGRIDEAYASLFGEPEAPSYGARADGTQKGAGFYGEMGRPDGNISTEISVGVNMDGKETEIPLMVPGLSKSEMDYLLNTDPASPEFQRNLPPSILDKAVSHARSRIAQGQSPFAQANEWPSRRSPASRAGMFDPQKLRSLMALGPEGLQAAKSLMEMDEAQVKAAKARVEQDLETKGRIIGGIRARPPEQRQAAYDEARQRLSEMGTDISRLPQQWDETFADQVIRESLEVAKALDMEREAQKFTETVRHNRAAEAVAAGGLAVRQGALGLARQREGRIAAGGGEDGDNSDLNYLMGD